MNIHNWKCINSADFDKFDDTHEENSRICDNSNSLTSAITAADNDFEENMISSCILETNEKLSRKQYKKLVKEENRIKRENKLPKYLKNKFLKKGKKRQ